MSFRKFRRAVGERGREKAIETEREKAKTSEYLALSALWRRQKFIVFAGFFSSKFAPDRQTPTPDRDYANAVFIISRNAFHFFQLKFNLSAFFGICRAKILH